MALFLAPLHGKRHVVRYPFLPPGPETQGRRVDRAIKKALLSHFI